MIWFSVNIVLMIHRGCLLEHLEEKYPANTGLPAEMAVKWKW